VRAGGAPTLRVYGWDPPCLSLGRNQPAAGPYGRAELERRGIDVVRRPTGGRAVLHARELTYSAVLPERLLGSPRRAYRAINEALVEGLGRLGVPASVQAETEGRARMPWTAPCFAEPVAGEVLALGRKLVGSAQVSSRGVLLQHGSLPLGEDAPPGTDPATSRGWRDHEPSGLAAVLGCVPCWATLTAALTAAWRGRFGVLDQRGLEPAERRRAALFTDRYRDPAWTWRL
jgi:lipoyl(octanoyl) transferase